MRALAALLLVSCVGGPPLTDDSVVKLVADGFTFTEGPVADEEGNLYFTDQPNDQIWILRRNGNLEVFSEPARRANGLAFDHKGRLLACADEKNELLAIDVKTGTFQVLVDGYRGKRLNGPNDLWVDPEGGIWFTDPFYRRPYWKREAPEQDGEFVYYLSPKGELVRIPTRFTRPNGIIGSEDGKTLYVADIAAWRTYSFPIQAPGRLGKRELVIEQGSDGLALDDRGHLYLTGMGVTVVDTESRRVVARALQSRRTSNVTFVGRTLIITAHDEVLSIRTNARDGSR